MHHRKWLTIDLKLYIYLILKYYTQFYLIKKEFKSTLIKLTFISIMNIFNELLNYNSTLLLWMLPRFLSANESNQNHYY